MRTFVTSILLFSTLSSLSVASPTKRAAKPSKPTCKAVTLTFDDLGDAAGHYLPLPGDGYNYKGFAFVGSQFGWVSEGDSSNGDWTEDDRETSPDGYQHTDVVVHSGHNAIMPGADGFAYSFDGARTSKGNFWFDLHSFWVRPEYDGAFDLRLECRAYSEAENPSITVHVPSLGDGEMFQVKLPAKFKHLWRCGIGATNLQQIILDDISACQWFWDYKKNENTPPWVKA